MEPSGARKSIHRMRLCGREKEIDIVRERERGWARVKEKERRSERGGALSQKSQWLAHNSQLISEYFIGSCIAFVKNIIESSAV